MKAIVYALYDPTNNQPYYVGRAFNVEKRLIQHLSDARVRHGPKNPVTLRTKKLLEIGLTPGVEALDQFEDLEFVWIGKLGGLLNIKGQEIDA